MDQTSQLVGRDFRLPDITPGKQQMVLLTGGSSQSYVIRT